MEIRKNCQMNRETVALAPTYNEYGKLCTVVYEQYDTYMVEKSPLQIIEENCIHYGCTYEGALKVAKNILGIKQMVPIEVCMLLRLYVMPTCSPESDKCCWLALRHIEKIEDYTGKKAKVIFANKKSLIIDVHKDTLETRRAKMALLCYTLEDRMGVYCILESCLGINNIWRL